MLDLRNITLTYPDGDGRMTAVDDVSLSVPDHVIAAVTGPSGSGKSSLLAVAATLVRPDSGTLRIGDRDVTGLDDRRRAEVRRDELGIVFQAPNLVPALTVREQLEVMARMGARGLRGVDAAGLRRRIDELLDEVGLDGKCDARPVDLSGGQQQRVNIARALIHAPAALLVDEPTSALDSERSRAVFELLARLTREHGLATVVVTHDVEYCDVCDVRYEMRDGRLRALDAALSA